MGMVAGHFAVASKHRRQLIHFLFSPPQNAPENKLRPKDMYDPLVLAGSCVQLCPDFWLFSSQMSHWQLEENSPYADLALELDTLPLRRRNNKIVCG